MFTSGKRERGWCAADSPAAHPCLHSAGAAGGGLTQEALSVLINNLESHTRQKFPFLPSLCDKKDRINRIRASVYVKVSLRPLLSR